MKKHGIAHTFGTQCTVCATAHPDSHREHKRATPRERREAKKRGNK